ncbi:MAG: 16S rRNA (guanine(966)-N(2))-methyltransferase RsmD [Limnobacter sp.]|uniref:16S rRNA (guanine(966)-N(2))-methyltransferase RsmD n=1 Tax=Limnobacter sp. TaxID=2003368 RepID=UPI00391D123A
MSGHVRIIGGAWRRLQLPVAPVEGLRPTPDRVRETVFNWLGQDCTGWQVLDLFSGTGGLGFEAASRGATRVQFVEQHRTVAKQLQDNARYLLDRWPAQAGTAPQIKVHQADVLASLPLLAQQAPAGMDLICLDPPFRSPLLHQALPLLKTLLKPDGLLYVEWHAPLFDDAPALAVALGVPAIEPLRHLKAGQVHAHLFAPASV